jgi:inorganic pyrophosphatase
MFSKNEHDIVIQNMTINISEIDCLIEVSKGSNVKYEFDKKKNMLRCDRILHTSMSYPGNYGYIENTLSLDGDPIDVLVLCDFPLQPLSLITIKLIGVLLMTDEKGVDEKLIAVPTDDVDPASKDINKLDDLPKSLLEKIKHFFEHYKDTEKNKWVDVQGFKDVNVAYDKYTESIRLYHKHG